MSKKPKICTKKKFVSEKSALNEARKRFNEFPAFSGQKQMSQYFCDACNAWHNTNMDQDKSSYRKKISQS